MLAAVFTVYSAIVLHEAQLHSRLVDIFSGCPALISIQDDISIQTGVMNLHEASTSLPTKLGNGETVKAMAVTLQQKCVACLLLPWHLTHCHLERN